jgi:hypothetical protein
MFLVKSGKIWHLKSYSKSYSLYVDLHIPYGATPKIVEGLILLLNSLLIQLLCPYRNKALEQVYQRIPLNEKVLGLVAILSRDSLAANCFGEAATAKAYLAATISCDIYLYLQL